MSANLAEIVTPLVDNGLYHDAEAAVKDLMTQHVLRQIEHYRALVSGFEAKHGMRYSEFEAYVHAHAQRSDGEVNLQKRIMLEEEEALDWKIAQDMLSRWLGLAGKSTP